MTERVHLATGLLLPVSASPAIMSALPQLVAEDGQSIIGREVLNVDLAAIAETFGLSGCRTGTRSDRRPHPRQRQAV